MLSHPDTDKVMATAPAVALGPVPARVLLVEDDFALREVVGAMLASMGYVVGTAGGGEEAMECLRRRSFDVVISDVQMPGIDGFTLARWIRRRAGHIRIILMTGLHPAEVSTHMASHVADEWIFKPFNMGVLEKTLNRVSRSDFNKVAC